MKLPNKMASTSASAAATTAAKFSVNIPDGLTDLLQSFTVAALREQPKDLLLFATNYFQKRLQERDGFSSEAKLAQFSGINGEARRRSSAESDAPSLPRLAVERPVDSDVDEDDDEDDDEPFTPPVGFSRRKSVAAERYNPEDDDDDDDSDSKCIHPKSDDQRKRLLKAIDGIFLFKSLDKTQLQDAVDAMFEKQVKIGETIIKQGDDGDNFYVIDSGKYDIYVSGDPEKSLGDHKGVIEDKGFFGELALMYNQPRAATIAAKSEGSIWALDRNTFRKIVLKSAFKKRQLYEDIIRSVPMLSSLEAYERMNLCDALVHRSFEANTEIVTQGDHGETMFFIENGEVVVTAHQPGDDEEREITRLRRGSYFGELALVTQKPRAATVKSLGPVTLAELDVNAFERLLGSCMSVMRRDVERYKDQLQDIFGAQSEDEVNDLRR